MRNLEYLLLSVDPKKENSCLRSYKIVHDLFTLQDHLSSYGISEIMKDLNRNMQGLDFPGKCIIGALGFTTNNRLDP